MTRDIGREKSIPRFVVEPQYCTRELEQHLAVMGERELAAVIVE